MRSSLRVFVVWPCVPRSWFGERLSPPALPHTSHTIRKSLFNARAVGGHMKYPHLVQSTHTPLLTPKFTSHSLISSHDRKPHRSFSSGTTCQHPSTSAAPANPTAPSPNTSNWCSFALPCRMVAVVHTRLPNRTFDKKNPSLDHRPRTTDHASTSMPLALAPRDIRDTRAHLRGAYIHLWSA